MTQKQYGRAAILALILAGLKGTVQIRLPAIVEILSDVLVFIGIVCGIAYLIKKNEKHP